MKVHRTIDWNIMSKLGLIEKINTEILHPMGLAIARCPSTGVSPHVLVSKDGPFWYDPEEDTSILSDEDLKAAIEILNK